MVLDRHLQLNCIRSNISKEQKQKLVSNLFVCLHLCGEKLKLISIWISLEEIVIETRRFPFESHSKISK